MARKPGWREVPPHDYCMSCQRGDATRAIMVVGDQDWVGVAFAVVTDVSEEKGLDTVAAIWELLRGIPAPGWEGRRRMDIRLCRHCAEEARQRFVDGGTPTPPPIYNANKLKRGEYEYPLEGVVQPVEEES